MYRLRECLPFAWSWSAERFNVTAEDLITDKHVAMVAVGHQPRLLRLCSGDLRDDPEIVKLAVRRAGVMLEYAGGKCRDNHEIVWLSITNGGSIQFASTRLQGDRALGSFAAGVDPDALRWLSPWLLQKRDILNSGLRCNPRQFAILPAVLRADPDVIEYMHMITEHHPLSSFIAAFADSG